ncbi:29571_t:CDS:1, partial [Racocetra persica]
KRKRNDEFKREIIIISESDSEDELPEVETLLSNIFKKQKLPDKKTEKKPVTKNDEFIFITNDKKYILTKEEIQAKIDRLRKRLNLKKNKTKVINLLKNFDGTYFYKGFMGQTHFAKNNPLCLVDRVNDFVSGYYGFLGYRILFDFISKIITENTLMLSEIDRDNFISEVIIPEMSVQLIMEDLNVDYELGIEIRESSSEYGSVHFIGSEDLSYSSVGMDAFMDKVTKELMDDSNKDME